MFEGHSRAVQATRTADAAADTKSDFVARETRWMAEVQALQSTWSLVEPLYCLPFLAHYIRHSARRRTIAQSSLACSQLPRLWLLLLSNRVGMKLAAPFSRPRNRAFRLIVCLK